MTEVLSQNEIEALLASMTAEPDAGAEAQKGAARKVSGDQAPSRRAESTHIILPLHKRRRAAAGQALGDPRFAHLGSGPVSYEQYDFRRPDKLSKDQLRNVLLLHETYASYLASSLSGYLRAQMTIEVVSVEQVPYEEYARTVTTALISILNVAPLSGQAILEIGFPILFSMLDRMLGGTGGAGKIQRDPTEIEKALAENIADIALIDLKRAWGNLTPLEFSVVSTETNLQFMQIAPGNDTVVLILFEVHMGEYRGAMSLCLPYLLLKPILGKLSGQRWFTSTGKKSTALYAAQMAQRLRTSRVPCAARLGTATMTAGDLARLEVGQIVPMNVPPPDDEFQPRGRLGSVDLVIGKQVKFRGKTGLRGKRLAVQIEEVVAPPTELISHQEIE